MVEEGILLSELLPCPFCGGEAELMYWEDDLLSAFSVACTNDDCYMMVDTGFYRNLQDAIDAWNTRADGGFCAWRENGVR